jgi:HEPN domain-containing protein
MAALALDGREYWAVYFFCQQAIEKRLKMVFVGQREQPHPLTHDLVALARAVGYAPGAEGDHFMHGLTRRYAVGRYGAEDEPNMPEDAEDARLCLERTRAICRDLDDMASRKT